MKNNTVLLTIGAVLAAFIGATALLKAQAPNASRQRQELAILKYDGADKIQVMTPQSSEVIRVFSAGGQQQKDIPEEEYCINWVANKMAKEGGWTVVNLNNRRIMMQRPVQP